MNRKTSILVIICIALTLIFLNIQLVQGFKHSLVVTTTPQDSNVSTMYYYNTTGSMLPLIRNGVKIEVIKVFNITPLYVGDVAIYRLNNRSIFHRIVFKTEIFDEPYYVFKGDNNLYPDEWFVPHSAVTNRLISVRYG